MAKFSKSACLLAIMVVLVPLCVLADDIGIGEATSEFRYKGEPIHPGLIEAFLNWPSDYRSPITVTVDVGAAYGSNEYGTPVEEGKDGRVSMFLEDGGRFTYRSLGRVDNDIHVVQTWERLAGGTGLFQSLLFVRFHIEQAYGRDGLKPSKRLLMSVVRHYPIDGTQSLAFEIEPQAVVIHGQKQPVRLEFDGISSRESDK